ncbi:hypothetical protein [Prescottella sp. R16]|uniref:hypothetical protein n=1 Tax=Prescottella sp. R16 TaxID=3064529 RepID=UPI00272E1972|nr:hypothetical protein [Prescottella sp. R16]
MGKHHRSRASAVARAAIVPSAAAAVLVAASGVASAAPEELPSQGGVTSAPSTQGGVTATPPATGTTPVTPAQPEPVYWVEPPTRYQNIEYQPLENYDYDTDTYSAPENYYVAPLQVQELHMPTYVEPTAPIIAPRETLRLGTFHTPQPNWVTDGDLDRTNNTSAVVEAEVSTFWRSLGAPTTRANRLAAAQIGMGAVGAGVMGAGGALVGGLVGGGIGTYVGAVTGLGTEGIFLPGVGAVTTAGTATGAAIGAAVLGIPAAVAGGVVGAGIGTWIGAGDLGEPVDLPIPDVDQPVVTERTQQTLTEWDATPQGAVAASTVRNVVESAPEIDRRARDFVSEQPGGDTVLAQIDTGLTTFVTDSSLGVATRMISEAVGAGIQA